MTSPIPASSSPIIGFGGFRLNVITGDRLFGGEVQDADQDPEVSSLRLKLDLHVLDVFREADNVFRFVIKARFAVVRKGASTEPHHILTGEQRSELQSKLRHLIPLDFSPDIGEQFYSDSLWPTYFLDDVRQNDNIESIYRDFRGMLFLSAFSRVGIIEWKPHGPADLMCSSRLDENVIGDMVLRIFSHLEEKWLQGKGLQSLKDMPVSGESLEDDPPETNLMLPTEAFAVAFIESELRLQIDE